MPETSTENKVDLQPGDVAPDFTAESTNGSNISLHDFKGKSNVVLYFYPEDMTSGCTIEAQRFRDDHSKYQSADTTVLGVSMDPRGMHQEFTEKEHLNFPLLVDTSGELCRAYGVPVDDHWAKRWTFLIGKDGKILKVYHKVDARTHSEELLRDLGSLKS